MSEKAKKNDNGQGNAEHIVALTKKIQPIETLIDELKVELRKHEGKTFTTEDGSTVAVSRSTETRSGDAVLVFDEDKFHELSDDERAILFDAGIVKMSRKTIKGSVAKVTVKLSKPKTK